MEKQPARIVRLNQEQARQIAPILFHSYRHEPAYRYLLEAHIPGYHQRLRATIREMIRLHFLQKEVVLGVLLPDEDRLIAVAFLSNVELKQDLAEQWSWRMRMVLTAGFRATSKYINYYSRVQNALNNQAHRMLSLIAVLPQFQQQGYGRQLIKAVHEIADNDQHSNGIYLDTGNSRYLRFYEEMGYQHYKDVNIEGLKEFILFRPNAESAKKTAEQDTEALVG